MPRLTEREIERHIVDNLPAIDHHGEIVEQVTDRGIRMRLPFRPEYMGADQWGKSGKRVYSGPMVMGFADSAMYGCLHGILGREIVAVIVTLTISFIRPAAAADLVAEVRVIRRGGRLAYLETYLYSGDDPEPVSHVTATYAVQRA